MFIQAIETRQGMKVGCPEKVAFRSGYINAEQLARLATPLARTNYGRYLLEVAQKR